MIFDLLFAFIVLCGIVAAAACGLYPVKGEKTKTIFGFKVRDDA